MTSSPCSDSVRRRVLRLARFALTTIPLLPACAPPGSARTPQALRPVTFGDTPLGQISVQRPADRPAFTSVVREGDPAGAVALAVVTEAGPQPTTALAAIIESRLKKAGFSGAEARPDPDGFRVRSLLDSPAQAAGFIGAVGAALRAPITQGPDLDLASRRLEQLRLRPFDSAAMARISHCTGELGIAPGEKPFDPASPAGIAALESLRSASNAWSRAAFSAVGSTSFVQAASSALQGLGAWQRGTPPQDPWPAADSIDVHARAAQADVAPSLAIAIRVRDPYAAAAIADHAANGEGPLLTRISNASGWRLNRVTATVRPRGACLSFRLARDRSDDAAAIESDAARVSALVVHEVETELAEARADGSVAGLQVLRAADPRDAAALAAWWSMSTRLDSGPERSLIDLGIPPPRMAASDPSSALDQRLSESQGKLAASYARATEAWKRPVVDARTRIEAGQGEFWAIMASPCGVLADTERDAGITALAAIAAAWARQESDGVTLEPWITTDGVGIIAHAPPLPAEGTHGLARRVADAAARAIINRRMPDRSLNAARGTILGMVERPNSPFGPALGALASALAPSHPAWLAPYGTQESIARAGAEIAASRWSALADGPIRLAVLANVDQAQADTAVRAADRWMLRRVDTGRFCPPLPPATDPPVTARDVSLRLPGASPSAVIGVPVRQPDADGFTMLDLLAEGLDGDEGWLARSLVSLPGTTVSVRVIGGSRLAALVVDISGPEDRLDDTIRQVRATLQRLARGAATAPNLARAQQRLADRELHSRLDPRHRLANLWTGRADKPGAVTLERWNAWMASVLDDASLSVVRVLPGRSAPNDD